MADKSLPMIFVTAGVVIAGLIGYGVINQGTETVDTVATPAVTKIIGRDLSAISVALVFYVPFIPLGQDTP
ncbi:MAG: hypothetical protein AAFX96_03265 [Pseudomonadota bacterium]